MYEGGERRKQGRHDELCVCVVVDAEAAGGVNPHNTTTNIPTDTARGRHH